MLVMQGSRIIGTETEFGIAVRRAGNFDPVTASLFLVGQWRPSSPVRILWDYENENPLVDARGYTVDGEKERPAPAENIGLNKPLPNAGRWYVDGAHPEYSTPECTDPMDIVAYEKAGDIVVHACLAEANRIRKEEETLYVYRNNTDGKGNSYGYHENYLVAREVPFSRLVESMVPFFISRQIFAGSGKVGFENRSETAAYQISQRADFFECLLDLNTMAKRPIINTRDEPHADPARYRRFHVIVGDANMAELSTYLKVGTTSLVLQMVEEGQWTKEVEVADPVKAIKDVSRDLTLKRTIRLVSGKEMTALEIQKIYLEQVKKYLARRPADTVGHGIAQRWEDVLTRLEKSPEDLSEELDWIIKWKLLDSYRERKGFEWSHPKVAMMDLQYHDVRPEKGLYHTLLQEGYIKTLVNAEKIKTALDTPPRDTRAYFRGTCMRKFPKEVYGVSWTSVLFDIGNSTIKRVPLMDPLRGTEERVGGIFNQADTAEGLLSLLTT
jgi:proteasome accessory factor A